MLRRVPSGGFLNEPLEDQVGFSIRRNGSKQRGKFGIVGLLSRGMAGCRASYFVILLLVVLIFAFLGATIHSISLVDILQNVNSELDKAVVAKGDAENRLADVLKTNQALVQSHQQLLVETARVEDRIRKLEKDYNISHSRCSNNTEWMSTSGRNSKDGKSSNTAVVIPLENCDLDKLALNLDSWRKFQPCDPMNVDDFAQKNGSQLTLVFYFKNLGNTPQVENKVEALWQKLTARARQCFNGGYQLLSADISQSEDLVLGRCAQFYTGFARLQDMKFDHFLNYDVDLTPIQSNWASSLLQLTIENTDQCNNFWQLGSNILYDKESEYDAIDKFGEIDLRMGFSSVYCLSSKEFDGYRSRVIDFFPPMGCTGNESVDELQGYDHAFYRFRMHRDNRLYMSGKFSKFRLTDFIIDVGDSDYDRYDILVSNPRTMFVRSEYPYLSEKEKDILRSKYEPNRFRGILENAYWSELGRTASSSERAFLERHYSIKGVLPNVPFLRCLIRRLIGELGRDISDGGVTFMNGDSLIIREGRNSTDNSDMQLYICSLTDVESMFPTPAHAVVAGAYMLVLQRLPGPEAAHHIERIRRHAMLRLDLERELCASGEGAIIESKLHPVCAELERLPAGPYTTTCSNIVFNEQGDSLTAECLDLNNQKNLTTLAETPNCHGMVYNYNGSLICDKKNKRMKEPYSRALNLIEPRLPIAGFQSMMEKIFPATQMNGAALTLNMTRVFEPPAFGMTYKAWTTDLHASPSACNRAIFESLGVSLTAKIDFSNCIYFEDTSGKSVCASERNLKILKSTSTSQWGSLGLDPCPDDTRRQFFEDYKDDAEFEKIDFIMCSYPAANCELYLPFNRSMLVYATTRLELGRADYYSNLGSKNRRGAERWSAWVRNLRSLAKDPRNVVAANNMYDVKYIEYFTGIKAEYLPSWCGKDPRKKKSAQIYRPTHPAILIAPHRTNLEYSGEDIPEEGWPDIRHRGHRKERDHEIFSELNDLLGKKASNDGASLSFLTVREAFPSGFMSPDLRRHPAAVFIPYQTSVAFFFEMYRVGLPMLVPSKGLLLSWVRNHKILWERIFGNPQRPSDMGKSTLPNPNAFNATAAEKWLEYYDIYQTDVFPHLLYFDSWSEAISMIETTDLALVSAKMELHNYSEFHRLQYSWTRIFERMADIKDSEKESLQLSSYHSQRRAIATNLTLDEALSSLYSLPPLTGNETCSSRYQATLKFENAAAAAANFASDDEKNINRSEEDSKNCGGRIPILAVDGNNSTAKLSSSHPIYDGTYRHLCLHSEYLPQGDELRCKLLSKTLRSSRKKELEYFQALIAGSVDDIETDVGIKDGRVTTLKDPFSCIEDITVNSMGTLECYPKKR